MATPVLKMPRTSRALRKFFKDYIPVKSLLGDYLDWYRCWYEFM
jgi:hypothetical protein